jgi:hypothetical protein
VKRGQMTEYAFDGRDDLACSWTGEAFGSGQVIC